MDDYETVLKDVRFSHTLSVVAEKILLGFTDLNTLGMTNTIYRNLLRR